MTRKESDALLREMRDTGCVIKVEYSYKKEWENEGKAKGWLRCMCDTDIIYYKPYDDLISAVGSGSWTIDNTFKRFYIEMRYATLIEKLPPDFYTWGL